MRFPERIVAMTALVIVIAYGAVTPAAQTPAAPVSVVLTPAQMEEFLLKAEIVSMRRAGDGVTNSRRATMTDGTLTHDAHIQIVDQSRVLFEAGKFSEVNFKDTYRYNIAAYRLARLLELDNVPMAVERSIEGRPAAVTWWVDDVVMNEGDRRKKKAGDPNPLRATGYVYRQRVFDELIQNRDRNMGNLVYTSDWKQWMIDHTRAFRLGKELMNPGQLVRIERMFYENLKKLTGPSLAEAVGQSLLKTEIDALVARRDAIVRLFAAAIAMRGEVAVLYTMPQ